MNYSLSLLSDCWASGASYLGPWMCGLPTWAAALLPPSGIAAEIIPLGSRRFRVLQKLGEGGYAVVYLVAELATEEHPHPDPELRALKKVLVQSPEHAAAVQQEMLVHSAVQHHPNILPLLDYSCSDGRGGSGGLLSTLTPPVPHRPPESTRGGGAVPVSVTVGNGLGNSNGDSSGGGSAVGQTQIQMLQSQSQIQRGVACFLFPVFRDGTLAGELERLAGRGQMLGTADVLSVFTQLARATAHIHGHGYVHRDLKPLNVLISVNPDHPAARKQGQQQGQQQGKQGLANAADVEAGVGLKAGAGADAGARYRCVVMDFGSARPRMVQVASRSQALQLQEDAEAHCSAPYRAPELFDVPSPPFGHGGGGGGGGGGGPLGQTSFKDSKPSSKPSDPNLNMDLAPADVWALGASLFHVMYGEPPFARAMNASGGSLALAVINCAIGWPRPPAPTYPPELHQLVTAAMAAEPADRPTAAQLGEMAEALAQKNLPDPAPAAAAAAAARR